MGPKTKRRKQFGPCDVSFHDQREGIIRSWDHGTPHVMTAHKRLVPFMVVLS